MKNKKTIIGIVAVVVVILLIIVIAVVKNKSNAKEVAKKEAKPIDFYTAFSLENIEKTDISVSKSKNETIASKYVSGSNVYVADANVLLEERKGKMIFVRESYNKLNIYQTTYKIDEDDSISTQVRERMENFERMCESYIGPETTSSDMLYGEGTDENLIPVEEAIYLENRLYSITYTEKSMAERDLPEEISKDEITKEAEEEDLKKYDINFYRKDNTLVCEFVNIL